MTCLWYVFDMSLTWNVFVISRRTRLLPSWACYCYYIFLCFSKLFRNNICNFLLKKLFRCFLAFLGSGQCPVGHRGEFPDISPYVRTTIRPSPPSQSFWASCSHWITWKIEERQNSHWITWKIDKEMKKYEIPIE